MGSPSAHLTNYSETNMATDPLTAAFQKDAREATADVARLRQEVASLKAQMRNVAGWLNNGCEPAKAAAELLLVAGLPPGLTG